MITESSSVARALLVGAALVAASGCEPWITHTQYDAATQRYRADCDGEPWEIGGRIEDENRDRVPVKRILTVTINGENVIEGEISPRSDGAGELSGAYRGKTITALCGSKLRPADNYYEVRCQVLIDGERTVTLVL